MNRLDAVTQAVQLSNQIGDKRTNKRQKEELYQDLIDLVVKWELTQEEIERDTRKTRERNRKR